MARSFHLLAPAVLNGTAREAYGLVHVERLREVFERASAVGGNRAFQVGMGGYDNHRNLRRLGVDGLEQFESANAGHADIRDHDVRPLTFQQVGNLIRGVEGLDGHIRLGQGFFQHPADGAVVVDDPHDILSSHGRSPGAGKC